MSDEEIDLSHILQSLSNVLGQMRECHMLREKLELQLFSHPVYGKQLRGGGSLETPDGVIKVVGKRWRADRLSESEKRRLPRLPDGDYIKLKVTRKGGTNG